MSKADHVRAAEQTREHACHWPGCTRQVPPAMWGCKQHWFRLPENLRDLIWSTYRVGQEERMDPSAEYLAAADAVQRWIAGHPTTMKALSLTQPWATLVAIGAKRWETRGWATKHRGPLAIHASKGFPGDAKLFTVSDVVLRPMRAAGLLTGTGWTVLDLPLGCVVATAVLEDVVTTERLSATCDLARFNAEAPFGNYAAGRFVWILRDVVALEKPVPAKGRLGLWEWSA